MPEPASLETKLTEMAEGLIDEVKTAEIDVKIDAFKALSSFFLGRTKLGKIGSDEPDDGTPSMADMRGRVKAAGEGK